MKATFTFGLAFAVFVLQGSAQVQQDNFREIGSENAGKTELLSCSVRSDVQDSAYIYFAEAKHFAEFHEGSVNDGRLGMGALDAVVTSTIVTWKTPSLTPGAKEETFSLDRKTGALEADVTYPAPPRHLSLHCSEDAVFMADPGQDLHGKWFNYFNNDHLCYSGYPSGMHSKTPIRVYVVRVELWNWVDKDHPNGLHIPNAPMNNTATAAFVEVLNKEALDDRSDTSFAAANGTDDATFYANLEYHVGVNTDSDHKSYLANVYVGGMGLTSSVFGANVSPPGQRWFLISYQMESASEYAKYDVKTPGEAAQIAFKEVAKRIVNGWTCSK
jgi:hypothetical protein